MAIKTPAQIQVDSNLTYPDNTTGQITPAGVRTLNTNWIDSIMFLSNTASYNVGTASLALNALTATSASLASRANTATTSTSSLTSISASYAGTASLLLGSVVSASYAVTANTALTATSSISSSYATNAVNAETASIAFLAQFATIATAALTASFASTASFLLGGVVSASYATSASYSITSSLPLNGIINATAGIGDITFTKGDGTQFTVVVPVSGSTATASLALNSELLDGLDSTAFVLASNFSSFSSSLVSDYATKAQVTSSVSVLSGSVQVSQNALSSSLSSRVTTNETNITTLTSASASFAVASGSTSTRLVALESFSSSLDTIYATDASVTASIAALSSSIAPDIASKLPTATYTPFSSSISGRVTSLEGATGSYALLNGNNTFTGNNIFGNVTASNALITSASVLNLLVQYETASVIYSSGSNQFGDAANDVQTLYGTVDVKTGPLLVTGSVFVSGNINMVNGADIVTHHVKAVGSNGVEIQNQSAGVVGLFGAGGSLGTTFYGQVGAVSFVGSGSGVIGVVTSSFALSSSYAETASVLLGTVSTASFALTASSVDTLNQDVTISGSLAVTGSQVIHSGSLILYSYTSNPANNSPFQNLIIQPINGSGNIISTRPTTLNSGSFIVSGSNNIVSVSAAANFNVIEGGTTGFNGTNAYVTALPSITGSNPNVNVPGLKNNRYVPNISNANVNNTITVNDNRGSEATVPVTVSNSNVNGTIAFTLTSGSIAVSGANVFGGLSISNNRTGSGAQADTLTSTVVGGASNVIQYFSTGSNFAGINDSIIVGISNRVLVTGSSAAGGTSTSSPRLNATSILGSNLIATGSGATGNTTAMTIVGTFNEGASGLLNDAKFTRFAVGTGGAAATRRTSFHVSASGLTTVANGLNVSQSLLITGSSFQVSGSLIDVTGSMTITGSASISSTLEASIIKAASYLQANTIYDYGGGTIILEPATQTVAKTLFQVIGTSIVTGSLQVTGSVNSSAGFTGSLFGTSSWSSNAVNATTASYVLNAVSSSFATIANSVNALSQSLVITGSFNGLVVSQSIASSTSSFNFGTANFFTSLVTGSTFFDITNPKPGETVNVLLTTQGAGQATASFSTNVKQVSGSSYLPTAGSNKNDILTFISFDGTSVYLANVKNLI